MHLTKSNTVLLYRQYYSILYYCSEDSETEIDTVQDDYCKCYSKSLVWFIVYSGSKNVSMRQMTSTNAGRHIAQRHCWRQTNAKQ